jgi:hypothetical protein
VLTPAVLLISLTPAVPSAAAAHDLSQRMVADGITTDFAADEAVFDNSSGQPGRQ